MARLPLAREGLAIILISALLLAGLGWLLSLLTPWGWVLPAIVWGWVVSFFRDPERNIARQPNVIYSPADGKVTDVRELENHELIGGPCVRIRIFLSIFNVHINRMPCAATLRSITHRPGKFLNAMKPESSDENESNTLVLSPEPPIHGPLAVRQISGLIARTIVCRAQVGDKLESGQRFGMIKFGSGTELIIRQQAGLHVLVQAGDTVRAGLMPVAKIEPGPNGG